MRKVIVAIDSLKGCLPSSEANQAATEGVVSCWADASVVQIPVSDGGEGWLDSCDKVLDGSRVNITVRDPLMRNINAQYIKKDDVAVIEIAQACGLTLLAPKEYNPMIASSYGVGQLVVDAIKSGSKHIIVGLGGSAVSDCGTGMIRAIRDAFKMGDTWDVHKMDGIKFTIATDVMNPLCGEQGAAHVFAPQKGATPEMVLMLDAKAKQFAKCSEEFFGYDCQNEPGAGAAGGLGYAFLQYMKANQKSGTELLLDYLKFDDVLKGSTLVITGEGAADSQTLMGKFPYGILQHARQNAVPVALIAGRIGNRQQLLAAGFSYVKCINPEELPIEEAMNSVIARKNICKTIQELLQEIDVARKR